MLCPVCKEPLRLIVCNNPIKCFIMKYECNECCKSFERHIFTNELGLVQMDKLFEITEAGLILKEWR